ncbi:MAG TPA: hypothetical protein VKR61_04450 [Bryobacteraceae bacterium]|nr:hypothetical protein [Bryobacteraceae bacterium]
MYYRIWQTKASYAEPVLLLDEEDEVFKDAPIQGTVSRTDALFEYEVSGAGPGFRRTEIRHYVLQHGRLERVRPVALGPRQFAAFWLTRAWKEASVWTENSSLSKMQEWLRLNPGPFDEITDPTRHCSIHPDLWQVETVEREHAERQVYFLVRWRPPYRFTMVAAGDRPWPACTELDPEAGDPRPLFPDNW